MHAKLFVVTHHPNDRPGEGKLCVVTRTEPPIQPLQFVPAFSLRRPGPTLEANEAIPRGNSPRGLIIAQARHMLGTKASRLIERALLGGSAFELCPDASTPPLLSTYLGAFIPDFIEVALASTPLSYGTIDILDKEDLERSLKKLNSSKKRISSKTVFSPGKRFMGKKLDASSAAMWRKTVGKTVERVTLHMELMSMDDVVGASGILAHFQAREDDRLAKLGKQRKQARYASRA